MTEELQRLFIERENKRQEAKAFLDEHTDRAGKISVEDSRIAENFITEVEELTMQIENELNKPTSSPILEQPHNSSQGRKNYSKFGVSGTDYRKNFFDALRTGFKRGVANLAESPLQQGGYLLPQEMHDEIIAALAQENALRQICRVVTTANDRRLVIQATPPTAQFVSEGQQITLSTETFDQKILGAYKIAAGVSITNELLSDSFYNVEEHLQIEFSKAIASVEENAFLNGSGVNEPSGILPQMQADSSTTITAAGAAISADDIISLAYSLKRPYRKNACWLMSDATLAAVRKLKDNNQAFIWQASLAAGEPPTLLGYPVYSSEFMPATASGEIPILFGDFQKFIIGQRGEMTFKPLRELHALSDVTTFLMIERIDAVLSDAQAIRGLKIR